MDMSHVAVNEYGTALFYVLKDAKLLNLRS